MVFLAFIGPYGSGKETAANYLVEKYNFIKLSFYETVMKSCQELFLLTPEEMKKENRHKPLSLIPTLTPKDLYKLVTTSLNASLNLTDEKYKGVRFSVLTWNFTRKLLELRNKNVVIPDLKYIADEKILQLFGVKIVKILRDGCVYDKEENDRMYCDYTLSNCVSMSEYLTAIDKFVCEMIIKGL